MPSGSKFSRSPIPCLTIRIIGPTIWSYPLRHGGLHGSTGSKGRDDCCVDRSDRNIAAIARTVRRGAASGVASVRQDPNSAAPVSSAITGHPQKFGATEFAGEDSTGTAKELCALQVWRPDGARLTLALAVLDGQVSKHQSHLPMPTNSAICPSRAAPRRAMLQRRPAAALRRQF
jgi:hypothetical protein